MDIRIIKEHLGRVKACYLRNETARALQCTVLGLKEVVTGGSAPTEIRSMIREVTQMLATDELVKKYVKGPLMYQPGKERELLMQLAAAYKGVVEEQSKEERAATFARKQKIDQNFNLGLHLLSQRQVSEADAAFAEAVNHYRDEHALLRMIGKALVEAGEHRRAAPYLRRALEAMPDDPESRDLMKQVNEARAKG